MESSPYVYTKNGNRTENDDAAEEYHNVSVDNDNSSLTKPNLGRYIYDDEDEMDCLKIANPATLVLAWVVMFITVFCILYYGIMNGLRDIGEEALRFEFCPSNISQEASLRQTAVQVFWEIPTLATDDYDAAKGTPIVVCDPEPGSNFTTGITEVICETTGSSYNIASCNFAVNVTGRT